MKASILTNDQVRLAEVPLALNAQMKLVDPLASLATVLVGAPQYLLHVDDPPTLSSDAGAAEMVEMYGYYLSRDVPLINFGSDPIIGDIISHLNEPNVFSNMPDLYLDNPITTNTLFRGITDAARVGPYISQLLLLNVPMGALSMEQKYGVNPTKLDAITNGYTVDWGRNLAEQVNLHNTTLFALPPGVNPSLLQKKYIYSGRALTEAVHNDPVYQFIYHASQILLGLGVAMNPGFPSYPNQVNFITGAAGTGMLCAAADISGLALKHSWYWKWQVYRKLRPEVFSLWIDNVLNDRVQNIGNYDISDVILTNGILDDVRAANAQYGAQFFNSYTLPQAYREGSPLHPSYPSGHATIAGAAITILKIYLDTDKTWISLPGLQPGSINRNIIPNSVVNGIAQSDASGNSLIDYTDVVAKSQMTITGELDKMATNIAFGRNWSGVHYRTDAIQGILLGEQVAIKYMEDLLSSMVQNNLNGTSPEIKFTGYAGKTITVKPTVRHN